jgi:hypothetical protein
LLDAAEGTAASIASKHLRARALAEIASVLAATDFSRSAGLTGEAERTARNINNDAGKARALARVAEALAATDPDRAVGLVNEAERTIKGRIEAGANAAPVTFTDDIITLSILHPEDMEGIFRDASNRSKTENARMEISNAQIGIADAMAILAATDPDRAERAAAGLTGKFLKARALAGIAASLAATNPDRAEQLAAGITGKFSDARARALAGIASALAATAPNRANQVAAGITSKPGKASALAKIAEALAVADTGRANQIWEDAENIANSITDETAKVQTLAKIASAGPERADQIWDDAERIARGLSTGLPCLVRRLRQRACSCGPLGAGRAGVAQDPGGVRRGNSASHTQIPRHAITSPPSALICGAECDVIQVPARHDISSRRPARPSSCRLGRAAFQPIRYSAALASACCI